MPEDMVVITKRSQIDEAIKLIDENIALQQVIIFTLTKMRIN
jgi:hypothetical protein